MKELTRDNFLTFYQYLQESENIDFESFGKVYLTCKRTAGQAWLSYKEMAGNKFFIQVDEDNVNDIHIDKSFPILNYHSDITKKLLKRGAEDKNVINHPSIIHKSGSKVEFHKITSGDEHIPLTVFNKKDAVQLGFPLIAKPKGGHSGIGIQVVRNKKEFEDLNESEFDTYSEYIDKKEEHRFFNYNGKAFCWLERSPLNDKAKTGTGKSDENMNFSYTLKDVSKIPKNINIVLQKYCKMFNDFPYMCFDVMVDKHDKVFVIESNAQPGVPFDVTCKIYEKIYEDFYDKKLDEMSKKKLDKLSSEFIKFTLKKDPNRFFLD